MNDHRYASLSGTLLARKGGAKPAMRPRPIAPSSLLDDLGWDDMGFDLGDEQAEHVPSSIAALTPSPKPVVTEDAPAPVHLQQRALAEQFGEPVAAEPIILETIAAPRRAPAQIVPLPQRQQRPQGKKAAFTLRLDSDRHLRLRLATAVSGRSAQQLVTHALDQFLQTIPEVAQLAGQLPTRSGKRS